MKKILMLVISLIFVVLFVGCGSTQSSNSKATSDKAEEKMLTKEEFVQMYSNTEKFKGNKVDFFARIFAEPERDDKGTYFQCYANNSDDMNTLIGIGDPKVEIKDGDIVHIVGTVKDKMEGTNAFGAKVTAPMIEADSIEVTDFATAFAPAIKSFELNKEINQFGYTIKVNKIEAAKTETRVYVTIINNTKNKIFFYSFNGKLTQGSKQIKDKDNYEANYPKIESEILPGIKEEGIILFDKIDINGDNLKLYLEGSSDNYELRLKPFEFQINTK